VVQLAFTREFDVIGELVPYLVIESSVFAEPYIHATIDLRRTELLLLEPECQDGIDSRLVVVNNRFSHDFREKFDGHLNHRCPRAMCDRPQYYVESANRVTI
jgi:hypothetical protein